MITYTVGEMRSSKIITHTFGGFREVRKCAHICLVFPPTLQLDLSPRQFCRALILTRQAAVQMADLKMCVEKPAAMKKAL